MEFLVWVVIGLLAAMIAKVILPGREPGGFVPDVIVGVLGAFAAGCIMMVMGRTGVNGFNLHSLVVAVIGSTALLFLYRTASAKRQTSRG